MTKPYRHRMYITRTQEIQVEIDINQDYHDVEDVYAVDLKTLEKVELTDDEYDKILEEAPGDFEETLQSQRDEEKLSQWKEDRWRERD